MMAYLDWLEVLPGAVRERLWTIPNAFVREVLGPYDFIVALEADTEEDITAILRHKIRPISGVRNTVTSMLRRKGIRVVSITEQAEDNATGRLLEGIIESVDEFYSENLAQDVVRGMREAASRGFFLASNAPFGYKRVKVNDGVEERPTLEVDPATAPVVREIFEKSLRGSGLKEICKELNDRGVTNRGKRWYKGTLHYVLRNEAYTGTAVWGKTSKGEKTQDPVRVEGAWPALVSRELFDDVQQAMRDRAPKVRGPGRVGSRFLLSGLLKCGVCGRPYSAQGAKSGQFAYYICGTLFREGAGTCSARYLNARRLETFVVEKALRSQST